jgi:hypothetical protein
MNKQEMWESSQKYSVAYAKDVLLSKGYIPHKEKNEYIRVASPDGSRFHVRLFTKHLIAIHYDTMVGYRHAVIPTSKVKREVNRLLQ